MKSQAATSSTALRAQVWPLIQDPASLVRLIPGCDRLEQTAPNEYRGQMQIPVAAVAGTYATYVHLLENGEPFTTRFEGEMSGAAGAVRGDAWFRLAEGQDAATSALTYEGQGMITGPLSRMDGRIAESVARSLIGQGLANLDRQLREQGAAAAQPVLPPVSAAGLWGRFAAWFVAAVRSLHRLAARARTLLGPHA